MRPDAAHGRPADPAARFVAGFTRSMASNLALMFVLWPGLTPFVVVPAFPRKWARHPALVDLVIQGRFLLAGVSLVSVLLLFVLTRQRRNAALIALAAADLALGAAQIRVAYPVMR
ncbi:MAG TPA: hypothetical protein VGN52_07055 [Burkholderiales bacterium]